MVASRSSSPACWKARPPLRQDHARARRIKDAGFPVLKTLEQFDFTWPTKINRQAVQDLFRSRFVQEKPSRSWLGESAWEKSHLAVALGPRRLRGGLPRAQLHHGHRNGQRLSAAHKRPAASPRNLKNTTRPQLLVI